MFWNNENLVSPFDFNVYLNSGDIQLSEILFLDDLLQELKTSNIELVNFLKKSEVISELIDNVIQLTEKDCCDKLVYSRVHVAYLSCEVLTCGSSEIFNALMEQPESLNKILNCLTNTTRRKPDKQDNFAQDGKDYSKKLMDLRLGFIMKMKLDELKKGDDKKEEEDDNKEEEDKKNDNSSSNNNNENQLDQEVKEEDKVETEPNTKEKDKKENSIETSEVNNVEPEVNDQEKLESEETKKVDDELTGENKNEKEEETKEEEEEEKVKSEDEISEDTERDDDKESATTKVVPQKATLVSKLISTIHSQAAAKLSCYITQDMESFLKLINLLVQNIETSGSFEILSTFIKRTDPPELRYAFCEILSKLNFVNSLIDVMTLSDVEDKQRNACQLLCDIIVIGRQEASEQADSGPIAQDMLAEYLESTSAIRVILDQMFPENERNPTAILCGMKVLQTLFEQKLPNSMQSIKKTIEQTQDEIEKHLVKFHELLLFPPKQEPIKTTFGIIQKPLGYMRLEVVNLIRALISTNSPKIITKLVELRTMNVIVDLFIEYCWNNLLHTQVEQALCLIINNYRHDEEQNYQVDLNQQPAIEVPSRALLSQLLNECDLIGRLLLPCNMTNKVEELRRNGEQANFGHIIQMINSIAINRDLDTIKDHLNEMKDKRPELYDRWTTFVSVDVASFKEVSLYYDSQSASNNVNHKFGNTQNKIEGHQNLHSLNSSQSDENDADKDQFYAYFSFTRETVLPAINVDVLPRLRRV